MVGACGGQTVSSSTTGGSSASLDCATATVPTYADLTIWPLCTGCHSSTLAGTARGGAPANVNFDTYAGAAARAGEALAEIEAGRMPPRGEAQPSAAQISALQTWASCGTPQ